MIISRQKAEEACETLGWGREVLDGELTAAGVSAQFRTAAQKAHPDAGGTMEEFVAVDRAKHILLAWVERVAVAQSPELRHGGDAPCPRCSGKGTITLRKGFGTMPASCPTCRGSGQLIEQEKTADGR